MPLDPIMLSNPPRSSNGHKQGASEADALDLRPPLEFIEKYLSLFEAQSEVEGSIT